MLFKDKLYLNHKVQMHRTWFPLLFPSTFLRLVQFLPNRTTATHPHSHSRRHSRWLQSRPIFGYLPHPPASPDCAHPQWSRSPNDERLQNTRTHTHTHKKVPKTDLGKTFLPQLRLHASRFLNRPLTNGVSLVLLNRSPHILTASAWVGYGWITYAIDPRP